MTVTSSAAHAHVPKMTRSTNFATTGRAFWLANKYTIANAVNPGPASNAFCVNSSVPPKHAPAIAHHGLQEPASRRTPMTRAQLDAVHNATAGTSGRISSVRPTKTMQTLRSAPATHPTSFDHVRPSRTVNAIVASANAHITVRATVMTANTASM